MGDFSGRDLGTSDADPSGDEQALERRRIHALDIDSFDSVLQRLQPRLELADGESMTFADIDDFHPDQLYSKLELFKALRQLRQKLLDPETAEQALAELGQDAGADPSEQRPEEPAAPGSMFENLLGGTPVNKPVQNRISSSMDRFIRGVVGPHIVAARDTRQYVDGIDSAISEQMRALLHAPAFQALESAWRGLDWLVSNLETGEELKLYLLDVGRTELTADFSACADNLQSCALYRRLVEQGAGTVGGEPWSALVGLYDFSARDSDLALLAALGTVASHAGGPFLGAAQPSIIGCASSLDIGDPKDWSIEPDFAEQWQKLRESAIAPWLGLFLPRLLLRLPYGAKTESVDRFDFEEQSAAREHDAYLWGNPALAGGFLLARSFLAQGWSMSPGDELDIDDLPAHSFKEDGESKMQACAEVFLSERQADAIAACGVMPLMSYRNRNQVRLLGFRSLTAPAANLSGPWV